MSRVTAQVPDFPGVNWAQPWLAPFSALANQLAPQLASGAPVAHVLNDLAGHCPVRFAPGDAAPPGEAYEAFIRRTGQVPTRDNLHDLFNGLVWLRFPQSKAALNRLQAEAIAAQGVGAVRGPVRDAITVFDENGALLLAPPDVAAVLWPLLLARDWRALLVTHRTLWAQAQLVLFGHALMEQLVSPRKPITAHVWVLPFEPAAMLARKPWLRWMPHSRLTCLRQGCRQNPSRHCRCWVCRAGGRTMSTQRFTPTCQCFARPVGQFPLTPSHERHSPLACCLPARP
jgi:hypothetical protein